MLHRSGYRLFGTDRNGTAEKVAPLRESWFTPPNCCGTGALAGRRRAFWLNKIVLMVTPILPPEGAKRVAGWWRSHRDRNPRIATSYDPPRMGRKSINAPMEGLCRCKPCGRFGPRDSCAPPGLDHRSGFLGVLVATLPPPQARLARSAGRIMRLNRSALRIHKTSKISNKEFFSSPIHGCQKKTLATTMQHE